FARIGRGAKRKSMCQHRDVVESLAKRRNAHRNHTETEKQILSKAPSRRFRREVAIRRGHHPHVDANRRCPTHTLEFLLLQHTQQLRLEIEAHLRDLVQQQRAAVRTLERALDSLERARECASFVTEQRALDEPLGQCSAIQLDERLLATLAQLVDGAREKLLPCSR